MIKESTHAIEHHMTRIAHQVIETSVTHANEHGRSLSSLCDELNNRPALTCDDEDMAKELRYQMELSMRILVMLQRKNSNFYL